MKLPPLRRVAGLLSVMMVCAVSQAADFSAGKAVYQKHCQACHQPAGTGMKGIFPPFAGNPNIQGQPAHIATVILKGLSGPMTVNGDAYNGTMPPLSYISDKDISDVIGFILNEWGGGGGTLNEDEIKALR
ncbi:cytochrome c [Chromatiaceae bacterium AAb-1]|jgi:nitrite reductase (NO-forming)/hydroxylamine reductase|nr:cytochrome c [Chromatiaceae bacterium AAb-1]